MSRSFLSRRGLRAGVLTVLPVVLFCRVARGGDELANLVTALETQQASSSCLAITQGSLSSGSLQILLSQGTACPLVVGETKLGWFYVGDAKFRYTSRDRIEQPLLRYNVKEEGHLELEDVSGGQTRISGTARTVLFATTSGTPPSLTGSAGEPVSEALEKHRETFRRDDAVSTAHTLAAAMLDQGPSATVRVELDGGDGTLRYTFDPIDSRSEILEYLGKYSTTDGQLRKMLRATALSVQPISRDRRVAVPPPFAMTAVDYELTSTGGDTVAVTARARVVALRDALRVLPFEVPGPILVRSGPGDSSARSHRVVSVKDGAGTALPFVRENRSLLVDLGRPAAKGTEIEIAFRIEGDYLVRPGGDNYWILEGEDLFPQPPWAGRQYTTHGVIRVKKPFVPVASGTTVRRAEEGDDNVLEVRSDVPSALTAVIAGKYEFQELVRDGLTIRVATYGGRNAQVQTQLSELAFGMIKHMERFLGPFPVPELDIVQVNDLGWGQAPLGMMLITNEAFDRLLPKDLAQIFLKGINERFAHEIAHQWWGHAVRWPDDEENWLSESFAEYCAGLMVKRAQGKGEFDNLKATWRTRGKAATRVAPVALANLISSRDRATYREYRSGLLYAKGPWLLAHIHDEIGDDKFLMFLKSYQKTLRGKWGSTMLVADLLRAITGKDYAPFFDANFWGTGMPE